MTSRLFSILFLNTILIACIKTGTTKTYTPAPTLTSTPTNNSKVYRNGKLLSAGTLALNTTIKNVPLVIGKVSGAYPGFYKGIVDDVYLYNRVLTEDEITKLYNHRF